MKNSKVTCICGSSMAYLGRIRSYHYYECPDCLRLRVINANTAHQEWFLCESQLDSYTFKLFHRTEGE